MKHKYVRHETLGVVIFPAYTELTHRMIGDALRFAANEEGRGGQIVSAGFVWIGRDGVTVEGKSISLNLGQAPDDADAIKRQLGYVARVPA